MRALASHQCGLSSIPGPDAHMWVEFVVGSFPWAVGFSLGSPVFLPPPPPYQPTQKIPIRSHARILYHELPAPSCYVGKQITFNTLKSHSDFLQEVLEWIPVKKKMLTWRGGGNITPFSCV